MEATFSSRKVRTGQGTIRRYIGNPDLTVIAIDRGVRTPLGKLDPPVELDRDRFCQDPQVVFLTLEPEVAGRLLARFGVKNGSFTSMDSIIGRACRYVETGCGMLVSLEVLRD